MKTAWLLLTYFTRFSVKLSIDESSQILDILTSRFRVKLDKILKTNIRKILFLPVRRPEVPVICCVSKTSKCKGLEEIEYTQSNTNYVTVLSRY